ncbi:hypothetical protein [Metabacillus sp. cB07]|uniref:hypothetical protein n=1 Tax=Metabacillus sp. cB07 TaxID=2806989 RepID=UPI00193991E4|nr:hypothetical protein [Metabacillus sp. cB07]
MSGARNDNPLLEKWQHSTEWRQKRGSITWKSGSTPVSGARKEDPSPEKVAALERVAPEKRIHHRKKW